MKITSEKRKMGLDFLRRLDQSRVERGRAIMEAQKVARETDPRPAEVIVREMCDEWPN